MKKLLNIGNSTVEISDFTLQQITRVPTKDFRHSPLNYLREGDELYISSVVPELKQQLQVLFSTAQFLTWGKIQESINFSAVDPTTIGADRLANALAAKEYLKLPALIVDCGTCINSEVIAANGAFLGGSISPGRLLQRQILQSGTGQLPETPLNYDELQHPGHNTQEAILTGIDLFLTAGIRDMKESLEKKYPLTTYLTGGDQSFFLEHIPNTLPTPKNLTLLGVKVFAELIQGSQDA